MSTQTVSPELKKLALDLNKEFPRSPRSLLAGYIIAGRTLDKCRAHLNGTLGEYKFNCPLDRFFFDFTGIDVETFEAFVATGANDEAVADWIKTHAKPEASTPEAIVLWNNEWRYKTMDRLPVPLQIALESVIQESLPANSRIIYFFDIIDTDEKRVQDVYH